ncbi:MAG: cytochrome c oxidase subunit II [Chthoniobacterales bacterium]
MSAATPDLPEYRVANMFDPVSTPAESIRVVSVFVLWITAAIFVIVGGLLTYAMIKFRRSSSEDTAEPAQIYGGTQIELAWTVIPILITLVLIMVSARSIGEIQNAKMPDDALKVRLVGHQWWWEVHYPDLGIISANEIHVPVSSKDAPRPTHLKLQSADVIHSFWIPQLAGKTDLVPNRDNETWIEPWRTGIYFGNCAEYCGTQHANMLLRVVVHTPDGFKKWVQEQKAPTLLDSTNERVVAGRNAFFTAACINCHQIDGTIAEGVFGPDLTKFASRMTLGAGVRPLTRENVREWVRDPQIHKVGALMPDMKLSDQDVDLITDFLMTLK